MDIFCNLIVLILIIFMKIFLGCPRFHFPVIFRMMRNNHGDQVGGHRNEGQLRGPMMVVIVLFSSALFYQNCSTIAISKV